MPLGIFSLAYPGSRIAGMFAEIKQKLYRDLLKIERDVIEHIIDNLLIILFL
jgi:hypothetical protein